MVLDPHFAPTPLESPQSYRLLGDWATVALKFVPGKWSLRSATRRSGNWIHRFVPIGRSRRDLEASAETLAAVVGEVVGAPRVGVACERSESGDVGRRPAPGAGLGDSGRGALL